MKSFLTAALASLTLAGCATLTAERDQSIEIITEPAGAQCNVTRSDGVWSIDQTPGSAIVPRAFEPLMVDCTLGNARASTIIEAKTRGRTYGNILLLGVPAVVDASTGAGYEYDPASVTLTLGQ